MHCRPLYIWILLLFVTKVYTQDIEPRRWTPLPLKSNIVGFGYGYTEGHIAFDPVVEIENAGIKQNALALQYVRPFKLGKKLARLDVLIPYAIAHWDGLLNGIPASVNRSGFADPRLRLSVNIIGPSAMEPKELHEFLVAHPVFTVIGVSLAVSFPIGEYYNDKLLNLGQNRFIFRPQAGFTHTWGNWSYELTGSVFIYTNNNDFFNASVRKQDPVFAMQTHLIRRFNNNIWGSLSLGTGLAGQSIINNQPKDEQENIMGALSIGFPILKQQGFKLVYIRSQTLTDVGGDTNTFGAVWSIIF
ncbi:transporter [Gelidibacter japonicus]|uniref:transporter n=1 Tax=Gelidibacter japonicus TaxID=1962232 RepID=UPI0013D07DCB|nr:transporter [Gelidibacter japonicus]